MGGLQMQTIADSWQRIHSWLSANAPKILGNLEKGASEAEIQQTLTAFGHSMPEGWLQLYRTHNGMNETHNLGSLFFGMNFLSLDRVVHEHAESSGRRGDSSRQVC